ncbi:methyltransferase [Amycolatopsis sp. cg9]|uniref:methyltransferase n=1 Tax=Amycolatopsis sp. cg9 TaxID=3238801 RepID=UPI0035233D00
MTTSAEPVRPGRSAARRVVPVPLLPGVCRPREDTAAIAGLAVPPGARASTPARRGAKTVLAVDLSRRARASTRFTALVRRAAVRPCRGDLATAVRRGPDDLVVAAPAPAVRATRGRDAGPDGRAVLRPGGTQPIVRSAPSDVDETRASLSAQGLRVSVARRARIPFGPVLSGRTAFLEAAGPIAPGSRAEELVVLRAGR